MDINCIICCDLFAAKAAVFSTKCGHVFHYTCLMQWLERSRTCPQCRQTTTSTNIHPVFFNIIINDEVTSLQDKIGNLEYTIKLKDKCIEINEEKCNASAKLSNALKEEVEANNLKAMVSKTALLAWHDKLKYYKQKDRCNKKLISENCALNAKLRDLENVNSVTSITKQQATEMAQNHQSLESLSSMVLDLKQELLTASVENESLSLQVKRAHRNVRKSQIELQSEKQTNASLLVEMKNFNKRENVLLKKKLKQLSDKLEKMKSSNPIRAAERIKHI